MLSQLRKFNSSTQLVCPRFLCREFVTCRGEQFLSLEKNDSWVCTLLRTGYEVAFCRLKTVKFWRERSVDVHSSVSHSRPISHVQGHKLVLAENKSRADPGDPEVAESRPVTNQRLCTTCSRLTECGGFDDFTVSSPLARQLWVCVWENSGCVSGDGIAASGEVHAFSESGRCQRQQS